MGIFGGLAKLATKVTSGAIKKFTPAGGIAQAAIGVAKRVVKKNARKIVATAAATGATAVAIAKKNPAATGAVMAGGVAGAAALMAGHGGGGGGRSYRRMNPANPRALRRAIRRVEAGARMFGKFYSFKKGSIKGARGVRVKRMSIRRRAA